MPESNLTSEQLRHLREKLEAKRKSLREKSGARVRSATRPDEEQLVEEGDIANQQVSVNESLGLASHEQALLAEVEGALRRIENGTFGVSEESGEPIAFERLDAIPWARANAAEAEHEERVRRGFDPAARR